MSERNFWQRICDSLFVKNPEWHNIIRGLPEQLDSNVVLRRTVSAEAVCNMGIRAQAWMGTGIFTAVKPNPLRPSDFPMAPLQWAYLQYMSIFFIMEGILNLLASQGLTDPEVWPENVLSEFLELAQTMSFYAAMVILGEKKVLPEDECEVEPLIREQIREITWTLSNKTADYGQAFLRHGIVGLVNRIWDKIARYATLAAESRNTKFESIRDTSMDMLGYAVLVWSILEDIRRSKLAVIESNQDEE